MQPSHDPRPLTIPRLLGRGLTRRCPLCGGGDCFESWFRMRERCPRCYFPLERVEGHMVGSLGMNTVVTFAALFAAIVVGMVVTYPDPPVVGLLLIGLAVAIVVPLVFYPFSRTLWSAIDLAMRPVEADDAVDLRWVPAPRRTRR